jgi:glutathione S-transferase
VPLVPSTVGTCASTCPLPDLLTIPLSWPELEALAPEPPDRVHGPCNAQSLLRLFGQPESAVRVTLFRDHHAWCPYCQKVWLWLEEQRISYRIRKVTMFCYGEKEAWYGSLVPSGMLPAVDLDGRLHTESDDILAALEQAFGPLGDGLRDGRVLPLRQLERELFRAWCLWLCRPGLTPRAEEIAATTFDRMADRVDSALAATTGPYFLERFGTADVVFTPYIERMSASLYYYKAYDLRQRHTAIAAWFEAMESRHTYRGTQSDFHTHAHDLPPQMGGCYPSGTPAQQAAAERVDHGPWPIATPDPETSCLEPAGAAGEALQRVLCHRHQLTAVNPAPVEAFELALRCALTTLLREAPCPLPADCDPLAVTGLLYLRDRISVPRDMSLPAARRLRQALTTTANAATAAMASDQALAIPAAPAIPLRHRRDQNPAAFHCPASADGEAQLIVGRSRP